MAKKKKRKEKEKETSLTKTWENDTKASLCAHVGQLVAGNFKFSGFFF